MAWNHIRQLKIKPEFCEYCTDVHHVLQQHKHSTGQSIGLSNLLFFGNTYYDGAARLGLRECHVQLSNQPGQLAQALTMCLATHIGIFDCYHVTR